MQKPNCPPNILPDVASSHSPSQQSKSQSYKKRLAKEILGLSTKVKSERGPPQVYKLPLVQKKGTDEEGVVMCEVGNPNVGYWRDSGRVVMVVGATGAGKTTLINGMANYFFGVEWKDNFRFKLVTKDDEGGKDESESKTKCITSYHFPRQRGANVPYGMTIIDTPGFGDTRGLEKDRRTMEQIRTLFMDPDGIIQLDGIGFVAESSRGRLTAAQRYIFDSILSIFGKDIGDIIFMMTTFADAHKQPVLDAVKKANITYRKDFKFNNSALFVDNAEVGNFDEMFWRMGMTSFRDFFNHVDQVHSKSLQQTREVLFEREQLNNFVEKISQQMQLGLTKINELHQDERAVKDHEAEILASKDFTYKVKVQKQRKIDLQGKGIYTTNCFKCSYTCHEKCRWPNDEDKIKCCAMKNGFCTICPKKCKWDEHKNTPYRYKWYEVTETRTIDELQRRYNIATSGKFKVEALMESLDNDLKKMHKHVIQLMHQIKESLQRLSEIALRPNPLSVVDYIDTLIESEKQQCEDGYRERIQTLHQLRREAALMSSMTEEQIDEYMKADHRTIFQSLQKPIAERQRQPPPQQKGVWQKTADTIRGYLSGDRS